MVRDKRVVCYTELLMVFRSDVMCSGMPEAQLIVTHSLLTSLLNRLRTLGV